MIRSRLWLTCAAVHDPVSPVLVRPAQIGWQARFRRVDLVIERPFKGEEVLARMKGWVSVDVDELAALIKPRGRLKLLDERELVVECETEADHQALAAELAQAFPDQVSLERLN